MSDPQASISVPFELLDRFCRDIFERVGVPPSDAALVTQSLCEADARGLSSHGVVRLLPVYVRRLLAGTTRPQPDIRILRQRGAIAVVDGDAGLGQVVGTRAMALAIEAAQIHGVGAVAVRHSSHFGIGALFVEQAVTSQLIGIAMTNAPANMPPHGGRSRFFGTNPLAIGLPCGTERPVILDMSTSVVARGKIVMLQKLGLDIPVGWAIDADGHPTQNAAAALAGAVLPMAGYKGSGLAMIIDAFCGILSGATFGPHIVDLYDIGDQPQNVGHFFMALDIETFMPLPTFQQQLDQMVAEMRAQPRQPDVERIYVPGEWEYAIRERSRQTGIELSLTGLQEVDAVAQALEVTPLHKRLPLQ